MDHWFVSNGKKVLGPFSARKMTALARAGKLKPTMQVSRDRETWVKATRSPFIESDPDDPPSADLDALPDPFEDRPLITARDEPDDPLVTAEQVDDSEGSIVVDAIPELAEAMAGMHVDDGSAVVPVAFDSDSPADPFDDVPLPDSASFPEIVDEDDDSDGLDGVLPIDDSDVMEDVEADEDSDALEGVTPVEDDSGVIEGIDPIEDDDSGVIEGIDLIDDDDSGVIEGIDPIDDDDSGVIEGIDPIDDDDSGVIEGLAPLDDAVEDDLGDALDDPDEIEGLVAYRFRAEVDGREEIGELSAASVRDGFRRLAREGKTGVMVLPKRGFSGWPDKRPPAPPAETGPLGAVVSKLGALTRGARTAAIVLGGWQSRPLGALGSPALQAAGMVGLQIVLAAGARAAALATGAEPALALAITGGVLLLLPLALAWAGLEAERERDMIGRGLLALDWSQPGKLSGPSPLTQPSACALPRLGERWSGLAQLAPAVGVLLALAILHEGASALEPRLFEVDPPPPIRHWILYQAETAVSAFDVVGLGAQLPRPDALGDPLEPVSQVAKLVNALTRLFWLAWVIALLVVGWSRRRATQAALAALGHGESDEAAQRLLARTLPGTLPALRDRLLTAERKATRLSAATAMSTLAPDAVRQLVLDSEATHVRGAALLGLVEVGDQAAAPALASGLLDPACWSERARIIAALDALGDRSATPALLELLADPNHRDVHEAAARALVGFDDPEAEDGLLEVLLDEGAPREARLVAAGGIGRVGGSHLLDVLDEALAECHDDGLATWISWAISRIEVPEERGTLTHLLDQLERGLPDADAAIIDAPTPEPSDAVDG